jgi:hypothetical protein
LFHVIKIMEIGFKVLNGRFEANFNGIFQFYGYIIDLIFLTFKILLQKKFYSALGLKKDF